MKQQAAKPEVRQSHFFKRHAILIIGVLVVLGAVFFLMGDKNNNAADSAPSADIAQGKSLTQQHCQGCHMLPEPALLDKENWKKILPEMGVSLGIHSREIKVPEEDRPFYPAHAAMDAAQWQSILDYYYAAAPATFPPQNKPALPQQDASLFAPLLPPENLFRSETRVTCVRIDNNIVPGRLFVYDATAQQLMLFDKRGLTDSIHMDDVIVDIRFYNGEIFACSIGNALTIGTSNNKHGKVFPITVSSAGKLQVKPPIFSGLARPVQVLPNDMNKDGRTDFIVCAFGGLQGSLSWMENKGQGQYQQHIIRNMPGSVSVQLRKNPQTQKDDIWALFAQGEEGIFHFRNKGDGSFETKQVLRFPPTNGSTSFDLVDVNKDGHEDIVYTCGDNGDATGGLKPFHGVYVFTNNGKNNFQQQFFYPMHGCYKVIAHDFTQTGTIDLSAIAYFTDPKRPEPFVYLKNKGNIAFTPFAPPREIIFGSLISMDAGDFNADGKQDLIIGNALADPAKTVKGAPFAILANTGMY